jgi:hypothetical protein
MMKYTCRQDLESFSAEGQIFIETKAIHTIIHFNEEKLLFDFFVTRNTLAISRIFSVILKD